MTMVLSPLQYQPNYWHLAMISCAVWMALTCFGNVFLQWMSWKKVTKFCVEWGKVKRPILTWSREEVWGYSCAVHMPCSVIYTARDERFTCIIHWCWHEVCSRIGCVYKLLGLWELDQRLFQVVQWPFYKNFLFLVKVQQVIPQWLLQIRTFSCSILTQKHLNTLFEFIIFLCIPRTLTTLRNVLKNNSCYISYRWENCIFLESVNCQTQYYYTKLW